MPVPQTAPRGEKDFSPPRFGITATVGLGRRNGEKRQALLVPQQQQDWQNNKAALNIMVFDSVGKVLKHLKKPALWAAGWQRLELKELIDSAALNGEIRVFVNNQGQEPVWFDSLYIEAVKPKKALIVQENHYDPYGNPVLPLQYLAETQALNPSMYQGKELDSLLQAYDFEARLYDPLTGRFMSSDLADQFASGYIGMGNNPVIGVDPDGKWVIPVLIGAFFGGFSGWQIGKAQGARGWDLLPYILGGAMFGAASGGVGHAVATSGLAFSQTLSIAASSTLFSAGMYAVSGNKSDISTSLGVASYNWSKKEFGFLGKKGNSFAENLGYGFGALANVSDVLAGFKPGSVELRTENDPNYTKGIDVNGNPIPRKDLIGHSQIVDLKGKPLVDWGPAPGHSVEGFFDWVPGTNSYEGGLPISSSKMKWLPIKIKGINANRIANFNPTGKYNLSFNSCVSMTSRALNISGAFNVGIHPYLLHAQMYLRSLGIRPSLFSYYLNY